MDKAESRASQKRWVSIIPDVAGSNGPIHGFFADRGVRETIESILVAVLLALLFRGFEGEAFIIPTGSMAPGLMGRHIDQWCERCGLEYETGASCEDSTTPVEYRRRVVRTVCPNCGYKTALQPGRNPDHRSNQGDRILVNKFIYDFREPERYDVIVFKNPNNGKQNLIKRLCGLPNEKITISRGDVYVLNESEPERWTRQITRKPPDKQLSLLQLVDDTAHRPDQLAAAGWPEAWIAEGDGWTADHRKGRVTFDAKPGSSNPAWIRYRNIRPGPNDWEDYIERQRLPEWVKASKGRLIGDHYAYNEMDTRSLSADGRADSHDSPGWHWVGDLALEATVRVGDRKVGELLLDLVEGGVHFTCRFDLTTGKASFSCSDPAVRFCDESGTPGSPPTDFATPLDCRGFWRITFANCDDRLLLWFNGRLIETPGSCYLRDERFYPAWSQEDPGDAQPAGVGIVGNTAEVDRLRVLRDVYYISVRGLQMGRDQNETGFPGEEIQRIHGNPAMWGTPAGRALFDASLRDGPPMFVIGPDQYFPMGDNSPESKDARIWEGPNWFSRDLLIGRAMLVYWPHARNRPVPYTPNFAKMRPIR